MKKIYLFTLGIVIGQFAFAQVANSSMEKHSISRHDIDKAKFQQYAPIPSAAAVAAIDAYIDHDAYEGDDAGYVWRFNSRYVVADTGMTYAAVAIDSLAGYTDPSQAPAASLETWPYPSNSITVDSIFFIVTHENNSMIQDTFIIQLVNMSATGPTNTIVYSDTSYSATGLSTGNQWLGTGTAVELSSAPNYVVPAGTKVAMTIKYLGSKQDTFSVAAGFVKDPASPDPNQPDALHTSGIPSSYMKYLPGITSISKCVNVTSGGKPFPGQNFEFWAKCTFNDISSVKDAGDLKKFSLYQNQPNPFVNTTTVKYELSDAAQVNLTITDLSGRIVLAQNEGNVSAGLHSINLTKGNLGSGVYFYTLRAGSLSQTKKLIVLE